MNMLLFSWKPYPEDEVLPTPVGVYVGCLVSIVQSNLTALQTVCSYSRQLTPYDGNGHQNNAKFL